METLPSPPRPATDLAAPLYYQLVYTLTDLLPPPLDDSPEALHDRDHAAIAKVAALLPVNANEADLAAQCIAARAQAEDVLRLLRQHAGDIGLVLRLNAQYASMLRTSLSVHGRLMRVQALRHKRASIDGAANQDAWAQHVAERSMLAVVNADAGQLDPATGPLEPAWPTLAPVAAPVKATAPVLDHKIAEDTAERRQSDHQPLRHDQVSEDEANSQHAAFETWLSEQPWNRGSRESAESNLRAAVREALAGSRSANAGAVKRESPAHGRANPGRR